MSRLRRKRKMISLNEAKSVGLLYNVTDEKDYQIVCNFVKMLQDERINVKALGFVKSNQIPFYCFPKLSYDYFTLKDLNWYYKPSKLCVNDFIAEEFDIVMDLSLQDNFSIQYISGLSRAKFKTGRDGDDHTRYYDFMIKTDDKMTLDKYIEQMTYYLTMLNTNNNGKQ